MKKTRLFMVMLFMVAFVLMVGPALAAEKPNIVVIMTDDNGIWNISAYHRGMIGGRTPNIDRIAK